MGIENKKRKHNLESVARNLSESMSRTRKRAVFKLPVEQQIEHKHIVASQEFVDNLLKNMEKRHGMLKRKKKPKRGLIKTKSNTQGKTAPHTELVDNPCYR